MVIEATCSLSDWIKACCYFVIGPSSSDANDYDHWISMEIQEIGQIDILLRQLENEQLKALQSCDSALINPILSILSKWWILALYESMRTYREKNGPNREAFEDLFRKVEKVRIPLAKHQAAKLKKSIHYPTTLGHTETGSMGWEVFSFKEGMEAIFRRQISDEILGIINSLSIPK